VSAKCQFYHIYFKSLMFSRKPTHICTHINFVLRSPRTLWFEMLRDAWRECNCKPIFSNGPSPVLSFRLFRIASPRSTRAKVYFALKPCSSTREKMPTSPTQPIQLMTQLTQGRHAQRLQYVCAEPSRWLALSQLESKFRFFGGRALHKAMRVGVYFETIVTSDRDQRNSGNLRHTNGKRRRSRYRNDEGHADRSGLLDHFDRDPARKNDEAIHGQHAPPRQRASAPASLSSALWRPTSSRIATSPCLREKKAAAWTARVSWLSVCAGANASSAFIMSSGRNVASLCTVCGDRIASPKDSIPHNPQPVGPARSLRRSPKCCRAAR
jgi:hypothetical protein